MPMQIKDLNYLRSTDETLKDRIEAISFSNYTKELKISQQLYLMYNKGMEGDNFLTLGTSKSTMICYATDLFFRNSKFLIPFIQEISGATFTVEGEKLTITPSSKVTNISLDIVFQSVSRMKENRYEIHNRFIETRHKKPCYYFSATGDARWKDYGCSVADALNEPDKVIDAWSVWALRHNVVNYERSVIDEDENNVTQQLIPQSAINTVNKLYRSAFSVFFRSMEFKNGIQIIT